jgi:predicted lipoprotein with Yx(FWY)xxD motif
MNWKKFVFGISMLLVLVVAACSPSVPAETDMTEAPTDESMDEPTPMMTEEEMAAETEEEMAAETEEPMPAGDPAIMVAETGLGPTLVGPDGMTLYMFVNDGPGESACYDSCATTWPPLLVEGEPVAGEGTDPALLGTTERNDGSLQLTYNGMPLYYYAQDSAAGDTNGQGVGGAWYIVNPAGETVTAAAGEDLPDY